MEKMKHAMTRKWIAAFLALILLAGLAPAAQAAKKTKDIDAAALSSISPWYYLPDTVPEGLLREISARPVQLYETSYTTKQIEEYATSVTVEFVSGDEALKDAIVVEDATTGKWENGEYVGEITVPGIRIAPEKAAKPGQAVFHITCESDRLRLEVDKTLRILSWDEYPLMDLPEESREIVMVLSKGAQVEDSQISARAFRSHSAEIAARLAGEGEEITNYGSFGYTYLTDKKTGDSVDMGYYAVGAYNNEESGLPVDRLMSPWQGDYGYWFKDYGVYEAYVSCGLGNVEKEEKVTIAVLPYKISFAGSIAPGETVPVSVMDEEADSGRTFTWALEGEGVTLDAEAGTLSAAEDAEMGSSFTLTATPSDGGYAVTAEGKVAVGILGGKKIDSLELYEGFSVPVLSTESGEYGANKTHSNCYVSGTLDNSAPYKIYLSAVVYDENEFLEDRDYALRAISTINLNGVEVEAVEEFETDGRINKGWTGRLTSNGENIGILRTARNNKMAEILFYSYAGSGDPAQAPKVTMNDLQTLAEHIQYDPSKASITVADGAITVAPKKEGTTLIGGRKMAFAAAFANKDKVNKKAKNDAVTWSVVEKGTETAPEFITIDKAGNLSAGAKLAEVKEVEVRASSSIFHTMGSYDVTVIPATKNLSVEPKELNFYVGTNDPQTVRAVFEPATVPPTGLTWTPAKKDTVEIVPGEDGTAVISPLAAGKINVTVKEPGGKSAVLKVNILQPVTGLTLATKSKVKAGGTVAVTAALEPKNPGNKTLEWSVDVDETVATVNQKGQVKIAKTAASGTVITVTCKALGAPEPIAATLALTVE